MIANFKEFLSGLILENLHPELQDIVKGNPGNVSKKTKLANKIKELSLRGEKTGVEGNMPKGSSRAYLKHDEPQKVNIDGKPYKLHVGTKVAIKGSLDQYHDKSKFDNQSLGALQNKAEAGDHWVNNSYRILTEGDKKGEFETNHHHGIFPPLIDHDHKNNEWSQVGHVDDINSKKFKQLTKTDEHPDGISHKDFTDALIRNHNRNIGKHWHESEGREYQLDEVSKHPLVEKFMDYHNNTGHPPHDYQQIKNLGVFKHPNGSEHIVARDHGYDSDVHDAYTAAFKRKFRR